MLLQAIQNTFDSCLRAAEVFERAAPGNRLFEAEVLHKSGHKWLAMAAGIDSAKAASIFPSHSNRAAGATLPLRAIRGGVASLLFVVRPCEFPIEQHPPLKQVAMFAPSAGVPLIEIREAFFRLSDLPDNPNKIHTLRWEVDLAHAQNAPMENWLQKPSRLLGYNPAHCPSHLHVNSMSGEDDRRQQAESFKDLRLGIGPANPLSVILSIAAWLRAN